MRPNPGLILSLLCVVLGACGGGSGSGDGGGASLAPAPAPAPPAAPPVAEAFAEVDRIAASAFAGAGIGGMGLAIYDSNDRKVFEKMYGDFSPDRRVAVASASKLVSGLVLFRLIEQGFLSLDSTAGQVLGWTGPQATITLRQLLSFTSGLAPSASCTLQAGITLADCVAQIANEGLRAPPGTRFDYGNSHLHVAARMGEVAASASWSNLFAQTLRAPLALPNEVAYYTGPRQAIGTTNPLIAGGLRVSMNEYARVLALAFHRGSFEGQFLIGASLFDEQAREPYPNATIGLSPMRNGGLPYRYGLAAWLECATPAQGCAVLSSPGAFGFTPWLDREAGYYGIIGMETTQANDEGIVAFSVGLAQELKHAIGRALGR